MVDERILRYSIPVLFIAGIIAFFVFNAQITELSLFISYLSSLSTVIMVLIYLHTNSEQLSSMTKQLNEMQFTRNVQSQPLIDFEELKVRYILPRFRFNPAAPENISLCCQIIFTAKVKNIGNSPATSIDIIPRLISENRDVLSENSIGAKINVISLKDDNKDVIFGLYDTEHKVIEYLVERHVFFSTIHIIYKNVLGMPFKQKMEYVLPVRSIEEHERLIACLKTIKTSEIDFSERKEKYASLVKRESMEEAKSILDELNAELEDVLGEEDEMEIEPGLLSGSFSVEPIQNTEYIQLINEQNERARKEVAPWPEVPWFLQVER